MTTSNPYAELIERLLAAHSQKKLCTTAALTMRKMAADLSQLTRDVAEAKRGLKGIANAIHLGPHDSLSTWRNLADACQQEARATLTRLAGEEK